MRAMGRLNVAVLVWSMATGVVFADQIVYRANLQPSSEVPPTTSKGSGDVQATFNTSTKTLRYTVSYQGLTGPATLARFHGPAPVGQNAGVQVPVDVPKARKGRVI